jgi:hypothetical protein
MTVMNMIRALLGASLAVLAVTGVAYGAYPGTYGLQDGPALRWGSLQIRVSNAAGDTAVILPSRTVTLAGSYGIPTMITTNTPLGMSRDGSRFVLQSTGIQKDTSFVVVRTSDLQVAQTISLGGSYAFDALSPDGRTLYLIEHRSSDFQHYVVRAYDLDARQLVPGRIADKTQASWVMQGWPAARVVTPNGRWVYTLYSNPGGFPFVHALDTVNRVAHCVGFAWQGDQNQLLRYHLVLAGNRLLLRRPDGTLYRAIDRATWAVRKR